MTKYIWLDILMCLNSYLVGTGTEASGNNLVFQSICGLSGNLFTSAATWTLKFDGCVRRERSFSTLSITWNWIMGHAGINWEKKYRPLILLTNQEYEVFQAKWLAKKLYIHVREARTLDYKQSPFFLRDRRASETRARVKITPREKKRDAVGRFSLTLALR